MFVFLFQQKNKGAVEFNDGFPTDTNVERADWLSTAHIYKFLKRLCMFCFKCSSRVLFSRILIPGDMVGAVIGKGGETVRKMSNTTNARYDFSVKRIFSQSDGDS